MNQKKYFRNRKLYGRNNSELDENDYEYHGKNMILIHIIAITSYMVLMDMTEKVKIEKVTL